MTDKKKKINTGGRGLFKGAIGYTYQHMVSESVRVPATKMASEKVAATVATFLNKGNISYFLVVLEYVKKITKKVACTVGTFMNSASVKVKTTQKQRIKVTCTVGTFLNSASVKVKTTQKEHIKVTCTVGAFMIIVHFLMGKII